MTQRSHQIGQKAAQTLYYAEMQAQRIGYPLTLSVTINFSLLGVLPNQATKRFGFIRNQRFAPWVRRPSNQHTTWSCPPTYSYGFENSRKGMPFDTPDGEHNVHVHWAVHVPAPRHRDFENRLHDWLTEIAGTVNWPENALKVNIIETPGLVASYPVKGASRAVAQLYGVKPEDIQPQGFIFGRRTGTTLNIGPAQRRAFDKKLGINRKRHLPRS